MIAKRNESWVSSITSSMICRTRHINPAPRATSPFRSSRPYRLADPPLHYETKPLGQFRPYHQPQPRVSKKPELKPWFANTAEEVVCHIHRVHFMPLNVRKTDPVAGFDIEGCYHNGIALDWLVERGLELIVLGEDGYRDIGSFDIGSEAELMRCRIGLIRNLRLIEFLGCTVKTDWTSVWDAAREVYPRVDEVEYAPKFRHETFGMSVEIFNLKCRTWHYPI